MHIAIAGNIGSGKTTLTKMLAKRYGWKANFEPVDNNPYLADYYKDMERWSFNLQIYFLNKRFHDVVEISRSEQTIGLSPIVQYSPLLPPVGVWAVSQYQCGGLTSQSPYVSSPW